MRWIWVETFVIGDKLVFAAVLDEIIRQIQGEFSLCMLFFNDILFVDRTRDGVNTNKGLKSWSNMKCRFSMKDHNRGQRCCQQRYLTLNCFAFCRCPHIVGIKGLALLLLTLTLNVNFNTTPVPDIPSLSFRTEICGWNKNENKRETRLTFSIRSRTSWLSTNWM